MSAIWSQTTYNFRIRFSPLLSTIFTAGLVNDQVSRDHQVCKRKTQSAERTTYTLQTQAPRLPYEQIIINQAGNLAHFMDSVNDESIDAWLFVSVMCYSMCPFVDALISEKQQTWIQY